MTSELSALAVEIEHRFQSDVAQAWFPRCIDLDGGYHQNFGPDWTFLPDPNRSLVFQSRMLWFTSQLADTDIGFRGYCQHGIDYFRQVFTDADGFVKTLIDSNGNEISPLRNSYSLAFAMFGLSAAAIALGDQQALEMAKNVFEYLELHHKDPCGRGYFELSHLDGTTSGLHRRKGQNSHLHLLEAFTSLHKVWPNPLVRARLLEIARFFIEELFESPGYLQDHVDIDGTRGDGGVNFGHDLEVGHLLISASVQCDLEVKEAIMIAIQLTDHALANGWDSVDGGFWGNRLPSGELTNTKIWWVQCEALLALATLYQATQEGRFLVGLHRQWIFIRDRQIDPVSKGFFGVLDHKGQPTEEFGKGDAWKAAYHDGRALLQTPAILLKSQRILSSSLS